MVELMSLQEQFLSIIPAANNLRYAAIGAPGVPEELLPLACGVASFLSARGCRLRSGGEQGIEEIFEEFATDKEVYLPYRGFNKNNSLLPLPTGPATALAKKMNPNWSHCSEFSKKSQASKVMSICGCDLDTPVDFVITWTPDGASTTSELTTKTGVCRSALAVACERNIPIFNLARPELQTLVKRMLRGIVNMSGERQSVRGFRGKKS